MYLTMCTGKEPEGTEETIERKRENEKRTRERKREKSYFTL